RQNYLLPCYYQRTHRTDMAPGLRSESLRRTRVSLESGSGHCLSFPSGNERSVPYRISNDQSLARCWPRERAEHKAGYRLRAKRDMDDRRPRYTIVDHRRRTSSTGANGHRRTFPTWTSRRV
ncbi:hypothetical protein FRC17_006984, partial [Serendipita sp. 399]